MDYEQIDKDALREALLNLETCPNCRGDILPVALLSGVRGCVPCGETWFRERWTGAAGHHMGPEDQNKFMRAMRDSRMWAREAPEQTYCDGCRRFSRGAVCRYC